MFRQIRLKCCGYISISIGVLGCHSIQSPSPDSRASILQGELGSVEHGHASLIEVYNSLENVPNTENPAIWVRQALDDRLDPVARGLSFQAFWCRFLKPPVGFRAFVGQYRLETLLRQSRIIDANRADDAPFENSNVGSGMCIWYPPGGGTAGDRELGVWLRFSRAVTPEQLVRIGLGDGRTEDLFILEFSTTTGCPEIQRKD
ncbi:MAG: hypothetical protein JWP03_1427 [Phycisphaerales bacterium]|jgi:hypothetical protein|nr:hypothetical protein [Phycisphaerales bacterium]